MKTAKKNIGGLTFKWKQKIKGNISPYADKGERERGVEVCLIGTLRVIMVTGKWKKRKESIDIMVIGKCKNGKESIVL